MRSGSRGYLGSLFHDGERLVINPHALPGIETNEIAAHENRVIPAEDALNHRLTRDSRA